MKTTSRTEKKQYAFESASRCGARTKGNDGKPCRCPAIRGKTRCRVHGGARGSGAPRYNLNALKHGETTSEAKAFKREIKLTIQRSKNVIKDLV
ncbi:MAG: HGGxSTG domain-containing protein [Legionellaceae bacterium]|nr:HGGxSTG domain-containing protein [Legionellaceae bacterium]